jgi:hypothetical protein
MTDRIQAQMSELMNELYEAFADPDAILNPAPVAVPDDDDAPAYAISVPGGRAYDTAHLSRSKSRNAQLLVTALQDLTQAKDDETRAAIRVFAKACIDAL